MKIRKKYQGALVGNKIVNTKSDSQTDTYSCDYINAFQPVILYKNMAGATASFTLNDDVKNYSYVEVIGCRGEGQQCSVRGIITSAGNTRVCLVCTYYGYGTSMWVDQLGLYLNGTSCSFDQYSSLYGSGGSQTVGHDRNIKVLMVIGYK